MKRRTKGSGYLRVNPDGSKTLFVSVPDPKTKMIRKFQATARSEVECRRVINQKIEEVSVEETHKPITVTQLCKDHLRYRLDQGMIKRSTADRDMCTINNQIEKYPIGKLPIGKVSPRDIDDLFRMLFSCTLLSPSSIKKVKDILNAAFNWALIRREVSENPLTPVSASIKKRLDALTAKNADDTDVKVLLEEQVKRFVWEAYTCCLNGSMKYPQGLHGVFLLRTGMRVGELLALRWGDYNEETGILRISTGRCKVRKEGKRDARATALEYEFIEEGTKNQKARNIQLTREARDVLDRIRREANGKCGPADYICATRKGTPLSDTDMEHRIETIYRNAGISKEEASGLHILRRTFATQKYRSGWDVAKIAAYMGDLESTVKKYYIADREIQINDGKAVAVICVPEDEQ